MAKKPAKTKDSKDVAPVEAKPPEAPAPLPPEVPSTPPLARIRAPREPAEYKCSARTWIRLRKLRQERAAGFLYEMNKKHKGDRTRAEWQVLWDQFYARPV